MTGYYHGFCKNFATVVTPLTDLLKAETKFVWNAECEAAFNSAKDLVMSCPVLSAPNFDMTFKLQDAGVVHLTSKAISRSYRRQLAFDYEQDIS